MSSTLIDTWCTARGSTTCRLRGGRRWVLSRGEPLLLAPEHDLLRVAQEVGDDRVGHEPDAPSQDWEHEPRVTGAGQRPDHDERQVRREIDRQMQQEDPAPQDLLGLRLSKCCSCEVVHLYVSLPMRRSMLLRAPSRTA